jgi:glutamate---cysteine ligase / carboxylate-amine ligase
MAPHAESFTIGVEEEYQIIDPVTRELSSDAAAVLQEARKTLGKEVQHEMQLSQIEVATPICLTLADVRSELTYLRHKVIAAAATRNKVIAASGTHPFSHWSKQHIAPFERYTQIKEEYQQLSHEQSIFGCHVHIGLNDRESAIHVMNHMRPWLPPLLALSSNSPFWWGSDTGYASFRTVVWSRWPLSGPPPFFSSYADYESLVASLIATGSIEEPTKIYWDMRLSERFNTLEVRIMDIFMTIDDAVMAAGLVRALVQTCYELVLEGQPAPPVHHELLRAASWGAARYGLEAQLIDPLAQRPLATQERTLQFLDLLRPALEAHADWEEVSAHVHRILYEGTGAARQRAIYQRTGQLHAVVDFIVAETAKGTK